MIEIRLRSFANLAQRLGLDAGKLGGFVAASAHLFLASRANVAERAVLAASDYSFCMATSATSDADGRRSPPSSDVVCRDRSSLDPTCALFLRPGRVVHELAARGNALESVAFDALCYRSPASQSGVQAARAWDAGHYCVMMFGTSCPSPLVAGERRHLARVPGARGCSGAGRTPTSDVPRLETFDSDSLPDGWTTSSSVGSRAVWMKDSGGWRIESTSPLPAVNTTLASVAYSVVNYFETSISVDVRFVRVGAGSSATIRLAFDNGTLLMVRQFATPIELTSTLVVTERVDLTGSCM